MGEVDLPNENALASSSAVGLPITSVFRGTLTRFLPASVLSLGAVVVLMESPGSLSIIELVSGLWLLPAGTAIGFGVGLEAMRRWLRKDAEIDGRRSLIAGLMCPLVLFIIATLGLRVGSLAFVGQLVLIGITLAVLLFFPWLASSEGGEREAGDEIDQLDAGRSGTF